MKTNTALGFGGEKNKLNDEININSISNNIIKSDESSDDSEDSEALFGINQNEKINTNQTDNNLTGEDIRSIVAYNEKKNRNNNNNNNTKTITNKSTPNNINYKNKEKNNNQPVRDF